MSTNPLIQIDAATLETLKCAAWLWSCEPGAAHNSAEIRAACHRAVNSKAAQERPASEPAKVRCPNCGEMTEHGHLVGFSVADPGRGKKPMYHCQPAQPEPAAPVCDKCSEPPIGERGGKKFCGDHLPADLKKPAAPVEMPVEIRMAAAELRAASVLSKSDGQPEASFAQRSAADALESFWHTHSRKARVIELESRSSAYPGARAPISVP